MTSLGKTQKSISLATSLEKQSLLPPGPLRWTALGNTYLIHHFFFLYCESVRRGDCKNLLKEKVMHLNLFNGLVLLCVGETCMEHLCLIQSLFIIFLGFHIYYLAYVIKQEEETGMKSSS